MTRRSCLLACLDCSFKISDSLSSGALGSLHLRDRSIGMYLASVHSIVMHADCCIVLHRARCTRADRCVCILLDRCASCLMRSCVVHACSMQCNARDRSPCMQATRCRALESLRGHALESLRGHAREVVGTIWNRSSSSRCRHFE